jgi:hypothetical protein
MYQTDPSRTAPGALPPLPEGADVPPHTCHVCTGAAAHPPARSGRRTALWWGLAGTLLSGVGWIALMLFEQYNASLAELRNDLKHFHETRAELVSKESFRKMRDHLKDCFKELHAAVTTREALQRQLRESEKGRRTVARALQQVRERLAAVEGRQAALSLTVPAGDR